MIIVSVLLLSARTGKATELARAHICNSGGTGTVRDYEVTTMRGRSTEALGRGIVQRRGKVTGHRSLELHVWHLVGKALAAVGYTPPPDADTSEVHRLRELLRAIASQNDPAWAQKLALDEIGEAADG